MDQSSTMNDQRAFRVQKKLGGLLRERLTADAVVLAVLL